MGDVRGLGLLWAIELVKDRKTKMPFDAPDDYLKGRTLMIQKVARKMMELGIFVYTGVSSTLIISPPLIVTDEEIDSGIRALDEALKIADQESTHTE